VAYWWLLAPLAGAQAPATTDEPARVLVTTLQTLPPTSEWSASQVDALERALVAAFAERHDLVSLDEVPAFEVHGYGPELYMKSCPPGRYAGCALVLGQRVGAPWAVGGTLVRRTDPFDGSTYEVFEVAIVDVERTVELARFSVEWAPGRQASIVDGIVQLFDELHPTAAERTDLREGADASGMDAETRARLAESLRRVESEHGVAISGEVTVREPERVTRASLDAYRRREGPTPWAQLEMSESEYVRFRNSGHDHGRWRRAARGRQGQLLVRFTGGSSTGPWHQNAEGQLLRSGFDLKPVHTVQYVEAVRGSAATGWVEIGFGLLPFLDVSGVVSRRTGRATIVRDEDVEGQASIPTDAQTLTYGTTQVGGRVTLAPLFLHQPARPVAIVGIYGWRGRAVPATAGFPRLEAPRLTVAELLLGIEVETSRAFGLLGRGGIDVPIGGTWLDVTDEGFGMEDPPSPTLARPLGWTVQVGVQVRVGIIGGGEP